MLFAGDFQKPVLLSAQFGAARKGLQATCGNQEGAGRASILWLPKDLERDGQKGAPHLGDCSTSGDEKIWNCCNISWQESSKASKHHKKHPYLLRDKVIRHPNQVWSTDITYLRMPAGNVYLMAIIDWYSRKVLSWRVFNTMDAAQCANLLRETIEEYGCPAIFNTDQGSQFTSNVFLQVLADNYIQVSMDGTGRALDNIRIERLWRSLKYEDIYLKRYENMRELKSGVDAYFTFYNRARFHQSLDYSVPDEMYESFQCNELEYKQAV